MLDITDLNIRFKTNRSGESTVKGISLHMDSGEMLGLVGESGSGKTVTALTIAGLIERANTEISGKIVFEGRDLLQCSREELRSIQGRKIGMIFQEPMTSLDPLVKVGKQVEETLRIHYPERTPAQRRELALEVMAHVDLPDPEATYEKYPHQLSGGQRQRAMIASAFICDPALLICDEPTTALDVTVQAQILDLLRKVNEIKHVAMLFISHDLNVVRKLCDNVAVMYKGEIIERGRVEDIFNNPQQEYTKRLIAAIPTRKKRHV